MPNIVELILIYTSRLSANVSWDLLQHPPHQETQSEEKQHSGYMVLVEFVYFHEHVSAQLFP